MPATENACEGEIIALVILYLIYCWSGDADLASLWTNIFIIEDLLGTAQHWVIPRYSDEWTVGLVFNRVV